MLLLVLTLFAVWLALMGLLFTSTLWIQGYIYSQPTEDLHWRAPAAGSALAVFLALWCFLAWKWPGNFDTLTSFSSTQSQHVDKFTAIKKHGNQTREIEFVRRSDPQGRPEYVDRQGRPFRRSDSEGVVEAIVIEDQGRTTAFRAEMNADGSLRIQEGRSLRYVEEKGGRVITEDSPGYLSTFRWGLLVANLLLNFLFLVLWVVCLWLVLQFQFWHAFGLGIICWTVLTFAFLPMLLGFAETAGKPQPAEAPQYSRI